MRAIPDNCRVEESLDILIGKWKPIILLHLIYNGTQRFSELKKRMPGVTQKMLTNQLRELEAADIVLREVYPEVPPRVEYSITEYGRTLEPILVMMHEWGVNHVEHLRSKERLLPSSDSQ
ncbi:winged helix-turn-helix transcriptional regulator [Paenibacillus glucanolyticus]|uniref:winged helix-turn-helix transcriptional regulator n=1 Tax=Paenibacillus glucanolyticus TaxID=59843 RepID=UPI00096E1341|nr:helix-turn-helix domain-containing protein [Paenibacillus glucanolyticus]OMF69652.1 transcriptional regulator [Paenibacillus glucanolyticus]